MQRRLIVLAVAVLVTMSVGVAGAASGGNNPMDASGTISACYNPNSGAVILKVDGPCQGQFSTPIQWEGVLPTSTTIPGPTTSTSFPTPTTMPSTSTTTSPSPTTVPSPTTTMPSSPTTTVPTQGTCTTAVTGGLGPFNYPGIVNSNGFNTYVTNDIWGGQPGTHQTICATDPGNVQLSAFVTPPNYTGVQSYPDVQQLMNNWGGTNWTNCNPCSDTPIAGLKTLTSTYATTSPDVSIGDWQAAYDIWLSNSPHNEIMIWVNTSNQRLTSNGATVIDSNVTIAGQSYTYQNYNNGLPQLVLNTNSPSGTVDILAALKYLQSIGQVGANASIGQLNFGWEICNTAGQTLNYAITGYTLSGS